MQTQYRLTLQADRPPQANWCYPLYAVLLNRIPDGTTGEMWHQNGRTPVSQFLTVDGSLCHWTVNLLSRESEEALGPVLAGETAFLLHNHTVLSVTDRQKRVWESVGHSDRHRLCFQTPTAFKSQGQYVSFPSLRLILQSLLRGWNQFEAEHPVPEEALDALTEGIQCRRFRIQDRAYHLKKNEIPGFVGTMELENHLTGPLRPIANEILAFSSFLGVGIKTTLGMGGVLYQQI